MGGSAHNSAPMLADRHPMQGRTASTGAERDRREGTTGRRAAAPVTPLEGESLPPRAGALQVVGRRRLLRDRARAGTERTGTARAEPPGKGLPPGTAAGAGTASPRCGTPQPYGAAPSAPTNGRRARPEPPPAPLRSPGRRRSLTRRGGRCVRTARPPRPARCRRSRSR